MSYQCCSIQRRLAAHINLYPAQDLPSIEILDNMQTFSDDINFIPLFVCKVRASYNCYSLLFARPIFHSSRLRHKKRFTDLHWSPTNFHKSYDNPVTLKSVSVLHGAWAGQNIAIMRRYRAVLSALKH